MKIRNNRKYHQTLETKEVKYQERLLKAFQYVGKKNHNLGNKNECTKTYLETKKELENNIFH